MRQAKRNTTYTNRPASDKARRAILHMEKPFTVYTIAKYGGVSRMTAWREINRGDTRVKWRVRSQADSHFPYYYAPRGWTVSDLKLWCEEYLMQSEQFLKLAIEEV